MSEALRSVVLQRLSESALDDEPKLAILGALDGDEALEQVLAGTAAATPASAGSEPGQARPGAFIKSITVEGFRGIGPSKALDLHPGPGLTLVVGRNGSGKSSFAEGLEMLLTAQNKRWSERTAVWKEGWNNLHHATTRLSAEFVLAGEPAPMVVTRNWPDGAGLADSNGEAQRSGKKKEALASLGWANALEAFRPFLSYNELGSMLEEGPSRLYDTLSKILGLDDLVTAEKALKAAQKQRKDAWTDAELELEPLLERLGEIDDERAQQCLGALEGKTWNLAVVQQIALGVASSPEAPDVVALLKQAAVLEPPQRNEVDAAIDGLRNARSRIAALEGTQAAKAKDLAQLLGEALAVHEAHGNQDCPVCGAGSLDGDWRNKTTEEVKRLGALAAEADEADREASRARSRAKSMLAAAPSMIARLAGAGMDTVEAEAAFKAWATGAELDDLSELADHLDMAWPPLNQALIRLRRESEAEVARREDLWRPAALDLAEWVAGASVAQTAMAFMPALKKAEKWLKETSADIRSEQFAPIADETQKTWNTLKQQSNVDLRKITLAGSGTSRKVLLQVTVDGDEGAALGVMSQGELHSLALSLFLPRATLAESPFRFIVIDDPVQSMDPARVDGLARVLEETANSRQVVVFTHDDRLPRACRLMDINANVIEVTRRADSVVELRTGSDPITRNCEDAWAVAKSAELKPEVISRVVGVFCRSALEAACAEVVARRRLSRGEPHGELDELFAKAEKLAPLMSLALFDTLGREAEILGKLNKSVGGWAGDTYKQVQAAAHGGILAGAVEGLVREAEKLARQLAALK